MEAVKLVPVFLGSDSWSSEVFGLKFDKEKGIASVAVKEGGMFQTVAPTVALGTFAEDKKGNYLGGADEVRRMIVNGVYKPGDVKWFNYNGENDKKTAALAPYTFEVDKDGKVTDWDYTKFSITGSTGTDHIYGGVGDDTLVGGKGRDAFTGGSGEDVFGLYGVKKNAKFITDFQSGVDKLLLRADSKKFQRWQRQGSLFSVIAKKRQLTGNKDMIGYNQTNGKMFFYNGKTGVAKLMAQFAPGTQVSVTDIKLTIGEGGDKA